MFDESRIRAKDGIFGPADDFSQVLFAVQDLDSLLAEREAIFRGPLEIFHGQGDYNENTKRFRQRDLLVQDIEGDAAEGTVLELKQMLIQADLIQVEETDQNSRAMSSSGSSTEHQ